MELKGVAKKMTLDDGELTSCVICAYKGLDSGSCGTCIAKAAALDRIKVAGGDSAKSAKDDAARVASGICVVEAVPKTAAGDQTAAPEEGAAKPVGIVRKKVVVDAAHVEMLMNGPPRAPLSHLSEDFFDDDDEDDPDCREDIVLSGIEQEENILTQFTKKGYAEVELEIDYGC